MKWSQSIPLSLVLMVGIAAAALVGVAMFITDQGEESLHLYRQITGSGRAPATPAASAMELQGRWMGMSLAAADSSSAKAIGVREGESGVVVVDIANLGGDRVRAAGLTLGDRVVGVDNKPVRTMADLYNVSRGVDPAMPTLLEVRRGDFPMTVVMPAMASAPLGAARPEVEGGAAQGTPLPATGAPMLPALGGTAPPVLGGAGLPAAWAGGQFYCPREGLVLPAGSVGPGMRCPRCQSPLQPYGRTWP